MGDTTILGMKHPCKKKETPQQKKTTKKWQGFKLPRGTPGFLKFAASFFAQLEKIFGIKKHARF